MRDDITKEIFPCAKGSIHNPYIKYTILM